MLRTEAEAAQTSCHRDITTKCIGTRCMAWRWAEYISGKREGYDAPDRYERQEEPSPRPDCVPKNYIWRPADGVDFPAGWDEPDDSAAQRRRGFCGLAGFPDVPR